MDTDIAPTSLASGRTVPIGAECGGGVHDTPPGCAWQHGHEEYVWTPVCFTTSPHHGLVWSYPAALLLHQPLLICPYILLMRKAACNRKRLTVANRITRGGSYGLLSRISTHCSPSITASGCQEP